MSNPEKSQEGQGQYGNFPPPPPGPPPAGQPQYTHPPSATTQHSDQQQQQYYPPPPPNPPSSDQQHQYQAYNPSQQNEQQHSIPAYNPANPVFAPPPTSELPADNYSSSSPNPQYQQQPQQQQQYQPQQQQSTYQQQSSGSQQQQQQQQQHHGSSTGSSGDGHKSGWSERFAHIGSMAAAPINNLAHKLGSQSFLPETLDKECDKAALILKTFCTKGVYADSAAAPTSVDPHAAETSGGIIDPTKEKPKNRVLVTIPPRIISKAVGLAIFTTLRAGFQVSGATGSGILIARLPDGSWSPPSGIQVHSVGGGFQIGLDIYDCICVINSKEALAAFMDTRVSLGSDLSVVAGPYGAGGAVDFGAAMDGQQKQGQQQSNVPGEGHTAGDSSTQTQAQGQNLRPDDKDKKSHRRSLSASAFKPVFSYVKSRGFYAGIQVDGTVVVERKDANAAFYGNKIPVAQILRGDVPSQGPSGMWPVGAKTLHEVLRGAEAGANKPSQGQQGPGGPQVPVGSEPAPATNPGASQPPPPAYMDDGVVRPEVGDHKYA